MPHGIEVAGQVSGAAPSSLLTGLVSLWLGDASSNLPDLHGTNTLTAVNTPGRAAGLLTNVASFNPASSQRLYRATNAGLQMDGTADRTIAYWVYFTDISDYRMVFGKIDEDTGNGEYSGGYHLGADALTFQVWVSADAPGERVISSFGSPPLNTWTCVFNEYDHAASANGDLTIWVNGSVSPDVHSISNSLPGRGDLSSDFSIGDDRSCRRMSGRVGPVAFWSRKLTPTERATFYNAGAGKAYPF